MTLSQDELFNPVIEAAGGVLWREAANKNEIAIIHRPKYDDWVLPKGKRDPGESWQETALREVREETGCYAQLVRFIGSIAYTVAGGAKVVLFWEMGLDKETKFTPNEEVDQIRWVKLEQALELLSYATEFEFLIRAFADEKDR